MQSLGQKGFMVPTNWLVITWKWWFWHVSKCRYICSIHIMNRLFNKVWFISYRKTNCGKLWPKLFKNHCWIIVPPKSYLFSFDLHPPFQMQIQDNYCKQAHSFLIMLLYLRFTYKDQGTPSSLFQMVTSYVKVIFFTTTARYFHKFNIKMSIMLGYA